eukprot:GHVL01011704.1.p1 GENE.GHVL01011704.1~~GHVL01011704.1.p1  ORF type:complete len:440 (+),score=103.50 GHVL01011704.1:138-1457(+)
MTGGVASPTVAAVAAMDCAMDAVAMEQRKVNDEYKVWKKNTPFLYDTVIANALEWPTLTVQWLPQDNIDTKIRTFLYGTHTNGSESNYLFIGQINLPDEESAEIDVKKYVASEEMGGLGLTEGLSIQQIVKIPHEGEVNRVQYLPSNPKIVATKAPSGQVLIFDTTKFDSNPKSDSICNPSLRLIGHKKEGYGLSWNTLNRPNYIASGAEDSNILYWDINSYISNTDGKSIEPTGTITGHQSTVEDVQWHKFDDSILGSVSDDGSLMLWDIRIYNDNKKPCQEVLKAHNGSEINSLSFSTKVEHLIATAGSDKIVNLWDRRKIDKKIHSIVHHTGEVFRVEFSPFNSTVLASGSADRRVMLWDMSKIGSEQKAEDAADGPPELLFIHGGHTSRIADFSWHPQDEWLISSCADDNILQFWQIADSILDNAETDDEGKTEE